MGWFDWFWQPKRQTIEWDKDWEAGLGGGPPQEGPPNALAAFALQYAYWTYKSEEQIQLAQKGVEQLTWPERLRLHHLNSMARLQKHLPTNANSTVTPAAMAALAELLLSPESPYRPRSALIWQGEDAAADEPAAPDQMGELTNASITHLGCLEVLRLDSVEQPKELAFISFDELAAVYFASPSLLCLTKLVYNNQESEVVWIPLLYGLTWDFGNEYDRTGRMTRFLAHLESKLLQSFQVTGIGVGQQDWVIRQGKQLDLFGLASIAHLQFPLDISDPQFDVKARARGLDPEVIRKQLPPQSSQLQ